MTVKIHQYPWFLVNGKHANLFIGWLVPEGGDSSGRLCYQSIELNNSSTISPFAYLVLTFQHVAAWAWHIPSDCTRLSTRGRGAKQQTSRVTFFSFLFSFFLREKMVHNNAGALGPSPSISLLLLASEPIYFKEIIKALFVWQHTICIWTVAKTAINGVIQTITLHVQYFRLDDGNFYTAQIITCTFLKFVSHVHGQ
jgi:hypothetical protein